MALFKRRRKQLEMSRAALEHRSQPDKYEDGNIINSCVERDVHDEAILESMQDDTISMSGWQKGGDMPIFAWDSAFEDYLKRRTSLLEGINSKNYSWFPWDVLAHLPIEFKKSNKLAFSQSSRPSCAGHAAAFAHHMSTLIDIAIGQGHIYNPANPLLTWLTSKKGSYKGGQSVTLIGNWVNSLGNFPMSVAGENNINAQPDYMKHKSEAEKHQSGIVWMPTDNLVERIFKVCKAGLALYFGNSHKVSGCKTDANGMRVATLSGSWGHACLEWNQKVYTSTGITKAKELVGKEFVVLSFSRRLGRVAAKKAYAWLSGHKECVAIKTNIGTFIVTVDHPFLMKDGTVVLANQLLSVKPNSEGRITLFSMTTRMDKQGYPTVSLRDGLNNKARVSRLIGLDLLGIENTSDNCVHHADGDPANNSLENLGILSRSKHSADHAIGKKQMQCSKEKMVKTLRDNYLSLPAISVELPEGVHYFSVKDISNLTDRCTDTIRRVVIRLLGESSIQCNARLFNRAETAYIISSIKERIQDVKLGKNKWKRPQDHYYGKRLIELSDCKTPSSVFVESVASVGIKPIVSVEVFDDEPDDKRQWTEHNYMLVPEENTNRFLAVGVASGNTSISSYAKVGSEEYIYWLNSHGPRYKAKDRFNAPEDGCWMTTSILSEFARSIAKYGKPGIIIPENEVGEWNSFEPIVKAPLNG